MSKLYGKTTNQYRKELTKKYKETRNKDNKEVGEYQGPWAGYG